MEAKTARWLGSFLLVAFAVLGFGLQGGRPAADADLLWHFRPELWPQLSLPATWLHLLGGFWSTAVVVAALTVHRRRHGQRDWPFIPSAMLLLAAGLWLFKLSFAAPRPDLWPHLVHESGGGFPSGHSAAAAALALLLCLQLRAAPFWWMLGGTYALCMGLSRLLLGVHYPSDVLGGWLWGAGLVLLLWGMTSRDELEGNFSSSSESRQFETAE